jgi:hypothetical protein
MRHGSSATDGYHQKNQPGHLKPQLMQHMSERTSRRSHSAGDRPPGPAALGLLGRDSRHYSQLSCS